MARFVRTGLPFRVTKLHHPRDCAKTGLQPLQEPPNIIMVAHHVKEQDAIGQREDESIRQTEP